MTAHRRTQSGWTLISVSITGALSVLTASALLHGCGTATQPASQPTQQTASNPTSPTKTTEPTTPTEQATEQATKEQATNLSPTPLTPQEHKVAERLASMGIDNPQSTKAFLAQLRSAADNKDQQAIVNLVSYPFSTYDAGTLLKTYESSDELLNDFDQVVTPPILEAMSKADYSTLFANDQGIMIGNGELWANQIDSDLKITAINSR